MSDSYSPEIVMLPSAENQIHLMYERTMEDYPQDFQSPEYQISGSGRFSQVQELLDGRIGRTEVRHYGSTDYELVDEKTETDLGQYLEENIHTEPVQGQNRRVIEEIGSFEVELPEQDLLTGYVLTGREQTDEDLPKLLLGEIRVFSDPRKDSEVVVKTQEPATL